MINPFPQAIDHPNVCRPPGQWKNASYFASIIAETPLYFKENFHVNPLTLPVVLPIKKYVLQKFSTSPYSKRKEL